jgi:serine incorporator 1/3
MILIVISFFIPNGFFMFWGNYVALAGATIFILLGLVLLVDFAHSWSETCLENWENSDSSLWQWILVGSTAGMYAGMITLTAILYAFFASSECTLNRFFISFNLALCILVTILCVHPKVQEMNPRSGLAQSSMVAFYCTYLIFSAISNHRHESCNPLHRSTGTYTIVLGGIFTFLALSFTTTRAATQSRALIGNGKRTGALRLSHDDGHAELGVVSSQPTRKETPRYRALLAAVEAGYVISPRA